jgi:hypothetical protein
VTPTYDPPHPHGLPEHLRTLTSLAGFTIDDDELDVTVAHYPDLIGDWVRAAATPPPPTCAACSTGRPSSTANWQPPNPST